MKSKAAEADDLARARSIAQAVEFTAYLRCGPHEKYVERGVPSYEQAKAMVAELEAAYSKWGRKGIVYAITPQGYTMDCNDEIMALVEQIKQGEIA